MKLVFKFKDGRLKMYVNTNGQRDYEAVQGLINPKKDNWDKNAQVFVSGKDKLHNNAVLLETLERCQQIIEARNPSTGKELFDLYNNKGEKACKPETFGSFIQGIIDKMKNGSDGKLPSRNYIHYENLLEKLKREGKIINVPLSEIGNSHFIQFSNYLLGSGGLNYEKAMKMFHSAHARAYDNDLNNNPLKFKFHNHIPIKETEARKALTIKEYNDFENFDLSRIKYKGDNPKELLFDALRLLYETKSRPVDVISFHTAQIENIDGTDFIVYIPEKKKGYRGDQRVYVPITDKARSIIDKYAGMSKAGYILPFIMNDTKRDKTDRGSWDKWNSNKDHVEVQMGAILKMICPFIGVDPTGMVSYIIRHTALTHAAQKPGADLLLLAKEAGTSVEMIGKHYTKNYVVNAYSNKAAS
jgi:integrase